MTDWRALLSKKGNEPSRDFDDIVNEICAVLTNEFSIELDTNAIGLSEECSDYIYDVHEAIELYVRDWAFYMLQQARPELGIGVSTEILQNRRADIAEQIYILKKGPLHGNNLETVKAMAAKISIRENEHLFDVIDRVGKLLTDVEAHMDSSPHHRST